MSLHRIAALGAGVVVALAGFPAAAASVNVYSYRQPDLIQPLLDGFTKETGIAVNTLFFDKGLEERIAAEGRNSPADVILSVDIGRLDAARQAGVTQAVQDPQIEATIPSQYRDPAGQWFALTVRGRIVYASKERVAQDAITYEELADPKWKGRVCMRDGQHPYNIGLFAAMIAHHGEDWTRQWMTGLRDNLSRAPAGNDRAQAKAIHAGECDLGLGNTYYLGLMVTDEKEPEQKEWAASIKPLFPDADGVGTHVNVSGMALAANAPNRDSALALMRYLASPKAQEIYAEKVFEYPVAPGATPSAVVAGFGTLKADPLPLSEIAANRKRASELVDEVRLNDGPQS